MDRFTRALLPLALVIALVAPSVARAQTQAQTPPLRITETVVVTADDADRIAAALNRLRRSRDPLVSQTVVDNLVKLTGAKSASGKVFGIGPLTEAEQEVVDLPAALQQYSVAGGSIRLQPRGQESQDGKLVYTLSRTSFIAMCAELASTGLIQVRVVQEIKMIVVARMIADLSEQQEQLMPEREVLEGVLLGFKDKDRRGVIIDRVLAIADALATNADDEPPYEFVPVALLLDFREIGHMGTGVFEIVARPVVNAVNVSYGGVTYSASVNHFVWFFLRFLLADPDVVAEETRAKRTKLGSDLLDHLATQLEVRALQLAIARLTEAQAVDADVVSFGDYVLGSPILDTMKKGPGISEQRSGRGPGYRALFVPAKANAKQADLLEWLGRELEKRTADKGKISLAENAGERGKPTLFKEQ